MNITPKDLLDAGVHLGHQTKRWNPRSKPYVFGHRQGITIIDLEKTHAALEKALNFIEALVARGEDILLVGTKRQAQELIREAASATGMPYVTTRWMGGTLTNFETIKKSLAKFKKYQTQDANGELAKLPKKEESAIRREMARMTRNFDGITGVTGLPGEVFVVDVSYEEIAVHEANRVNIASIGLVDTNSDPTLLTYPIPGNDDATKSIRIVMDAVVEAIQKGLAQRQNHGNAPRADKNETVVAEAAPVAPAAAGEPALPAIAEELIGNVPERPVHAPRKRTAAAKVSAVAIEDV